jgi:hypothetical protein
MKTKAAGRQERRPAVASAFVMMQVREAWIRLMIGAARAVRQPKNSRIHKNEKPMRRPLAPQTPGLTTGGSPPRMIALPPRETT